MRSERIKEVILGNAEKIKQLHARINETFKIRDQNDQKREEWKSACRDFHANYDRLAFPGGYDGALERIVAGDAKAMENAICFLECRPYFFRSGYMFKSLLSRAKRAPLSEDQSARLQIVVEKYAEWKNNKKSVK